MRSRIRQHYPDSFITSRNVPCIYIADFSERTQSVRGIEVHSNQPTFPVDTYNGMDCFIIQNPGRIEVDINVFNDNQFKDERGNDLRHCECCIFPSENHDESWVVMLEIKDCKPKNITEYKDDVIEQIISVTNIFRQKHIITDHKVYGVISMPRKKVSFNNTIFGMPPEYTRLKRQHKILFAAANYIEIKDNISIMCYE